MMKQLFFLVSLLWICVTSLAQEYIQTPTSKSSNNLSVDNNIDNIGSPVDLGLSVLWADHNVGANSPEEYGGYYSWGATQELTCHSHYNEINGRDIAGTEYDVAHMKWGNGWRLPTKAEMEELINLCTWEWTTYNGVKGCRVTGSNGNSIFLPAGGYFHAYNKEYVGKGSDGEYWTSTVHDYYGDAAFDLSSGAGKAVMDYGHCPGCQLVRPVFKQPAPEPIHTYLGEPDCAPEPGVAYALYNPNYTAYAIFNTEYSTDKLWVAEATSFENGNPVEDNRYSEPLDTLSAYGAWQLIKEDDYNYLYNIGARKYLITPSVTGQDYASLRAEPTPIHIERLSEYNFCLRSDKTNDWDYLCICPQYTDPVRFWISSDYGSCWQFIRHPYVTPLDDAEITGIESIKANASILPTVYTLSGIYLGRIDRNKLPSGFYIIDGKKFVVK